MAVIENNLLLTLTNNTVELCEIAAVTNFSLNMFYAVRCQIRREEDVSEWSAFLCLQKNDATNDRFIKIKHHSETSSSRLQ